MFRDTFFQYIFKSAPIMRTLSLNYNQYWGIRSPMKVHKRFEIISDLIEPNSSILDIGCGRGELLSYLTDLKEIKGYGIDISDEAIAEAKKRGLNVEVANVLDWSCDKVYDYIIMSEVLEHIMIPEELMFKIKQNFHKGLIISIPNTGFYKDRLRLLFGHFPVQWVYHPSEHVRFWTTDDFIGWLKELNFKVIFVQASTGTRILCEYLPSLFGAQIVFLCQNCK